ncbi:MAG TPA: TlpA disulfide reductase family protein [Thermoanaerobaculia bacterium]|nr:TlpA disulfide reductase family protein [Thermoanaerobaculia bacterium]
MLARSVVQGYGGKARFVSENYGDSALAKKYGVTRYPAIFVDDVLVATPNDFGFYGHGEKKEGGRYAPLKSAEAHERFRADLAKMIDLELAGRKDLARAQAVPANPKAIAAMPALDVTDLDGKPLRAAELAGRVVLVEMWATWCPPCRGTLGWLGELKKRYGDRLAVVAVSVESDDAQVRKLTGELNLPLRWVAGTPALVRSFGDLSAVPTLFLFDGSGKTVDVFYGAPPTLHTDAETKLAGLLK